MKTKIYILVLVFLALMGFMNAQTEAITTGITIPGNFDLTYQGASAAGKLEFPIVHKKITVLQPGASPVTPSGY